MKNDSEHKLIDAIYKTAMSPENYEEMMALWGDEMFELSNILENGDDGSAITSHNLNDLFERHFKRADGILDVVNAPNNEQNLEKIIAETSDITFILAPSGLVVMASEPAKLHLKIAIHQKIDVEQFIDDDWSKIRNCLQNLNQVDSHKILGIVRVKGLNQDSSQIMSFRKILDVNRDQYFIQLSAVHIKWDDDIGKTIGQSFGLTETELYIAKHLVKSARLTEIAKTRGRSIETIRSQLKSLYKKVNLNSQSELVQLFSILQNFSYEAVSDTKTKQSVMSQRDNYLTRANGRKLYFEAYGNPLGRPVLFLHGVFLGTKFSQNIIDYIEQENLYFICPHRAGFGNSETYAENDKLAGFIDDMEALFDQLKINKCPVIGHQGGSYYGYVLANSFPDRVMKVRSVNSSLPYKNLKQIKEMRLSSRIIIYTSIFTPKLLPHVLKGAQAQIVKQGYSKAIEHLYTEIEFDRQLSKIPEIHDIFVKGIQQCFQQGIESFLNDSRYLNKLGWEPLVAECLAPVEIFSATENKITLLPHVREFVAKYNHIPLTIIEGGPTMLYKYPEKLLCDLYND